jgi:hypothetical protein
MRRRLQFDLGKMRDGISAALRHVSYLLEDKAVQVLSRGFNRTEPEDGDADASHAHRFQHAGLLNGEFSKIKERRSPSGSSGTAKAAERGSFNRKPPLLVCG